MNSKFITKISGKSDKKSIFMIEKDFSIINIEKVKKELDEIIEKHPNFHLELKNLDNFDLSSIQLLSSIKKKLGDNFSYSVSVKEDVMTILKHSGFENILNK